MKKLFRKPLALLLAMALIVGSLTVAVYALTEEESGIFNLYTKFYRIDGDDEKAVDYGTGNDTGDGTLYVKKGDRIKAVMSAESLMADGSDPDSEFNIYGISLLLSYNKNLVVLDTDYYDPSKGKTVFNSKIGSISVITGEYQAADLGISDSNKQFINAYSAAITDIGDQHSDTGFVLTRDGLGKDIITWYFTVLQDATLTDESLFDVEEASVCSMDDSAVYTTFITSFDEIGDISSDYYYLELNSSSETIAIGGTVNYDVNNTTIPASGTIATGNTISDKGDGVYEEIGENGGDASLPTVTTEDGSTFIGWATTRNAKTANVTAATLKAESPDTLYAVYSKPAVVKYVYDNGTPDNSVTYDVGDTITAPADPVWAGHNFKGWTDGTDTYTSAQIGSLTVPEGGKTFTAIWDYIISYEYTYENVKDADKLEAPAAVNKDAGADLPDATAATKDGYTVTDWKFYDADDNEITDGKMPAGNVTAKATQSGIPYTLTYTFTGDIPAGVTAPADSNVYYIGDTAALEPVSPVDGFTFSGWKLNNADVTEVTFGADNIEVTGEWTRNDYTITYEYTYENVKDADKLEAPADATRAFGADLPDATAADAPDGYTVTDWVYYDADDNEITDGKMPAGNVTAKATQSGIPYTLTYTFTGDVPAGVTAPADSNVYYIGDTAVLEPVNDVTGFTFTGWKLNNADVTEVTFGADNIEVTGEWTRNDYTITYEYTYENVKDADKLEAPAQVTKAYQADLPEVAAASKDGYTVTDWVYYDADDNEITDGKMPAGPVTAKATQSGIAYHLTYTISGNIPTGVTAPTDSNIYYIGDTVSLEPVSDVTGYTFSGWKLNDAVVTEVTFGAGDIAVAGEWTINNYTITYLDDENQQIDVQTYAFNEEVTAIDDPEKTGYLFAGWSYADEEGNLIEGDLIETMPAYNIIATAIFNAAEYKVTYIVDDETYEEFDVTWNEPIDTPPAPDDKIDAVFMGWTDDDGTTVYSEDEIGEMLMPNHDVEFTAVWLQLYSLTLQYEDGTPIGEVTYYAPGDAINVDDPEPQQVGLIFAGWEYNDDEGGTAQGDLPEEMPAYDIVAVATFIGAENDAVYIVDGEEFERFSCIIGDEIDVPQDPEKTGYSFDGWFDADDKSPDDYNNDAGMPSSGVIFYAEFTPIDYTLTYILDNGEEDIVQTYHYEDTVTAPEDPEKTGYTFEGWDPEVPETMPAEDVEVTAQWKAIDYTLTYTISGDIPTGVTAPVDATAYHIGDSKTLETVSPVDGFTFSGWKLNNADVTEVTFGADDIEVTGEWTRNNYTITYEYTYENVKDADKLEAPAQVTKAYQADLPEVSAATKDGYTVTDWVYYDADDNEITDGKMPAGNVTAKATQSGIPYTLTYTFTGDIPTGITAPTDDNAYYIGDTAALEPVNPVDGFTFNGWKFNNADATEVTFGADNIEVTGEWTRNDYTITYEYTYENVKDADKLEAPEQVTKAYQADLPEVAAATKDGYTVTDWVYYDADDNEITDGKMPAGNVTAKATQSGIAYSLTYTFTGDIPAGITAPTDANDYYIGDTAGLETVTAPTGYTFSGWKLNDAVVTEVTFGADDIEVTGEWTRGEYTITCILDNGEENIVLTYNYGDAVEAPADPEKEGYKFIAWSYLDEDGETTIEGDLPTVMPAYNIVATAQYEEDEFTATYMVDGEELDSYDVIFGEEIDTPADPEKDGYNFTGWLETTDNKAPEDYADGMPAKDLVFDAQWKAIDYTLTYTYTGDVPAGLTAPTDTTAYHIGDSKTLETVSPVDGFTFSGWKLNDAVVTEVTFGADDIEVTGEWTRNNYTITYEYTYENVKDADKLEAPEQVTKAYQADLPEVAAASKDGYTVTDWVYYDANDNAITDGKMPAGNVTAKATQSGIAYSLTYTFTGDVPAGITAPTDDNVYYIGDSKTLETVSPVDGFTFSGWKLNDAVVTEVTFGAGNVEVTGEWTRGEYTITYEYTYENVKDADKLEAPAPVTKAYQADLPEVAAATKDGYTVTDWVYYDADDNEITDGKMPAGNVTARATQSGIPYTLTYTFTGEAPAGVTAPTDSAEYYIGDSKTLEVITAPAGYIFSGWKLNDAVVTEVTFGAGNVEVTGEWTKAEYTITYEYTYVNVKDADKLEAPAQVTKAYGADLPEVAAATKDGYTVTDWVYYDADDNEITDGKMPAGNVTAKATQSGIPYTLTYTFTGDVPAGITAPTDDNVYYIGDSKTLETVSPVDGYTFSGWKLNDAVVTEVTFDAGNVEVTGEWVISEYTVTFVVDGEQVGTASVIAGEKLTAADFPEDPTKQYFTFAGWADSNGTPYAVDSDVEGDITLYAQWNRNPVKLMPANGNTTTMIERGGKVETYNTASIEGFNAATNGRARANYAPFGVTSVEQAYSDVYGDYTYTPETENWFIYGLTTNLTSADLANYIEVAGDGRIQIDGLKRGRVITGSTVSVYDQKGTAEDTTDDVLVEKFYIVIFGDVNGDGNVNNSDDTEMVNELASRNWSKDGDTYVSYITKAANINKDGLFNSSDETELVKVIARTHEINQTTGKVVAKG